MNTTNGDTLKYVLNPANFSGNVLTIMRDGIHNDCGNYETLEELRQRENNPNLQALTPEEFVPVMRKYEESLCEPFQEITEERYYDFLGFVPPRRQKYDRFFNGECYTGSLYTFCFMLNDKYYSALRSVSLTDEELAAQINEFSKTIK
jgi:hypothetical protein